MGETEVIICDERPRFGWTVYGPFSPGQAEQWLREHHEGTCTGVHFTEDLVDPFVTP